VLVNHKQQGDSNTVVAWCEAEGKGGVTITIEAIEVKEERRRSEEERKKRKKMGFEEYTFIGRVW